MGSGMGYRYEYSLSMVDKDEILPASSKLLGGLPMLGNDEILASPPIGMSAGKYVLFEVRVEFILRRRCINNNANANVLLDSERYNRKIWVCSGGDDEERVSRALNMFLRYRLNEYWMSDDEVSVLCGLALDFAARKSNEPRHASLDVIPVAVCLSVCTVQQEGESLDECMERAIVTGCMPPLYLCPWIGYRFPEKLLLPPAVGQRTRICMRGLMIFRGLIYLPRRVRVDSVALARALERCPVCLRDVVVGALVTTLPCCGRAFHSHCIISWLEDSNLCPICYSQVYESYRFG